MKIIEQKEISTIICDVTGKTLEYYNPVKPDERLGATIKLNNPYGCLFDGSSFHEIHISEQVLKDVLEMLKNNYLRETEFMGEVYNLV